MEQAQSLGARINSWADLVALRDEPVHVVGAGSVEGAHLLLFLLDHGFTRLTGHDFATVADFPRAFTRVHVGWPMAERKAMLDRLQASVDLRFRDRYLEGIDAATAIVVTQGWFLYPANRRLEDPGFRERMLSLVQLYVALSPGPVVGVSGSHGKSTTTRLLAEILEASGRTVLAAGNDRHGRQALGRLEAAGPDDILVLEISNRHLKVLDRSPNVAVLTNIYPNHLDEHGGWEGYVAAKTNLVRHQRPGDIAVLNADQAITTGVRDAAVAAGAGTWWFGESFAAVSDGSPGVRVEGNRLAGIDATLDMPLEAITLPGRHNAVNVAAAAAAALAMGVDGATIEAAVRRFRGLKHRLQFVWEAGGARFYDDLNSTTPTATTAALETLGGQVVWILGGDDKGLDATDLAAAAGRTVSLALALPGPGTDALLPQLEAAGVTVERVDDLGAAVARAVEAARPGDAVLLSPACPGFFSRNYVGVGTEVDTGFRRAVREATLGPSHAAGA